MQKGQTKKSGLSTMQAGKDMRGYELSIIYAPCDATALSSAVIKTVEDIEKAGFKIRKMDVEGEKLLAYPINKDGKEYPKGIFAYFVLSNDGSIVKLTDTLQKPGLVLRYLLVKQQLNLKEYK